MHARDWQVTNVLNVTVSSVSGCTNESEAHIKLHLGSQLLPGTSVLVTLQGDVRDVASSRAWAPTTRTTTVPL